MSVRWEPREAWGAKPASSSRIDWSDVLGLAVHQDAISPAPTRHDSSPNGCYDRMRDIQRAHLHHPTENYSDIAYSIGGICPHGSILEGRGWDARPGSNGTHAANRAYPSVFVMGVNPRPAGIVREALIVVRNELLRRKPSATQVHPHSAFVSTACPGDRLRRWIDNKGYEPIETEEDDMTLSTDDKDWIEAKVQQGAREAAAWAVTALVKALHERKVPTADWLSDHYKNYIRGANALAADRESRLHEGDGVLTDEELTEAVKRALREGTDV